MFKWTACIVVFVSYFAKLDFESPPIFSTIGAVIEHRAITGSERRVTLLPGEDRKSETRPPERKGCAGRNELSSENSLSGLTICQAVDLAFSHYNNADMPDAERVCRLILADDALQVDTLQLLGLVLGRRGEYVEAVKFLREAIMQAPGHSALHNNLGMALHQLDKTEEAVLEFRRAIDLRDDFAKAYNNLGAALMKLGRLDEAVTACMEAIGLQSGYKEGYNNLGLALRKKGDLADAVAAYTKAVEIDPDYAEALSNLGMALIGQGKLAEAGEKLHKVVSLAPNSAKFRNNLGVLFNRLGRFEEAVAASEKAIALSENYLEAYNNLGTALMELGRFSEAKSAFEAAISINSECAEPHHNLSLILLLTGQFKRGWQEYEWRWRHEGFSTPLRPFAQPWWDGSIDGVGKLLLWDEQGIGDEVLFSGLIRHISSIGIDLVVECDNRLASLLRRTYPDTTIVERSDRPSDVLKDAAITHQIPMFSIPHVLGLPLDGTSFPNPHILVEKNCRDRLRKQYKADNNPLLVGISWKSGNSQEGEKRSIDLEKWGPILKTANVRFVNLQYGECSDQLQAAFDRFGVEIFDDETVDPLSDLESFCGQVAAMDLVISVDNSTVHFAGALGAQVWTMLPTVPDWRWGVEGDSSSWYPTMKLFRQEERGNWGSVISSVAEKLGSLIEEP